MRKIIALPKLKTVFKMDVTVYRTKRSYSNEQHTIEKWFCNVIWQNERYLIIEDDSFTKVQLRDESRWSNSHYVFWKKNIGHSMWCSVIPDYVHFFYIWTKVISLKTVRTAIEKHIADKWSWSKVDLSFLK